MHVLVNKKKTLHKSFCCQNSFFTREAFLELAVCIFVGRIPSVSISVVIITRVLFRQIFNDNNRSVKCRVCNGGSVLLDKLF